jgi:hypothetical protein
LDDKARDQYLAILQAAEQDPSLLPATSGQGAITRVRAQLIGLLRKEGKYEQAMQQAEALIQANPRALEPLLEKGRILQAWAASQPARYDAAVSHWTTLRTTLARLQRKPPEYYEVVYHAAACLMAQSEHSGDKNKALQAEQLLKATLVLSPRLSGSDMVAKYDQLLGKALDAQGKSAKPASGQ